LKGGIENMNRFPILLKKIIVTLIVIIFGIGVTSPSFANENFMKTSSVIIDGNTLYVGGSGEGNYSNIQDAIDNASDGDTIFVYTGIYEIDDYIHINKSIRLIGENKYSTIIDGIGIEIDASNVEFSGFTVQNSFGIMISPIEEGYENSSIYENIFKSNEDFMWIGGLTIFDTNYNNIFNNSFIGCGLTIGGSYHNSIKNNIINGKPLEYLEGASDKVIKDAGQVILIECQNITLENLELNNSFMNLQIMDCFNCKVLNNSFSNNGAAGLIYNSSKNIIFGNAFSNNSWGLTFGLCEENKVTKNSFENNYFCILIVNSSTNTFSYNNFKYKMKYGIINHNIVSTESDNKWFRNYWNRPRILPLLIWNFDFGRYRYFPFFPTSPDVDWRPALKPNIINGASNQCSLHNSKIDISKISEDAGFNLILKHFPILKNTMIFV
jgi:parallel beta-helix repeat protein